MVTRIPRHGYPPSIDVENDIDTAAGLEGLTETVNWQLEEFDSSPDLRARALSTALALANARCEVDPDASQFETWEAWVTAMQVGSAWFAMASRPEGSTVTCRIKEKDRQLPTTGPQPHVNAGSWVTAFYLALVCRDVERLNELARVPVSLLRESGATLDEYIYSWVETLQSFWLGRDDVATHLTAAVDGTGPDSARYADQNEMSLILYPPIILFYRVLRADPAEFNEALVDALNWHKTYWTWDDDRQISNRGFVALGPLAIACLAKERGLPVEVESEYLPKALLDFAWRGEIDT
ncbi:immunity 49 family protein [Streptomyces sp. NPDC059785]|uniref:immunity 49 family protein n=1 Tax=Streptomyces sp. NPDC059785 TaxID=3346945 RepID=UPI00364916F8